ncbi:hypothetical protein SLEP1_g33808 [Rubroshorea leprosula]|uniref:Retrotransposon gag domain-containing protein n=1 Tax=Rubroshorea leprosula TaxID=152421 RepID=A0AAV5KI34_9ROSI|nr:hypothetical protein SLEP1_g33808 [Rubroshorea leprosula]
MAHEANLEKVALENRVENMKNTLKELMASFQSLQAILVTRAPLTTNPLFEGNVLVANLPVATSALTLGKEPMSSCPPNPTIGGTSGTKPFDLNADVATVQSNDQEETQVVKLITEDEDKAIKAKVQLMEETLKSIQGVQTNKPVDISFDSLTSPADAWFSTLDKSKVKSWHDLTYNFMKQYEYNTSLAPSRENLQRAENKRSENFKEFVQRWHGLAARVQPPLIDHELRASSSKKVGQNQKKENENGSISSIYEAYGRNKQSHGQFDSRFQALTHQSTAFTSQPRPVYASGVNRPQQVRRHFDKLPLSYTEVFQKLVAVGIVTLVPMLPVKPPFPAWYNPQARCEYHSGGVGHDLENCLALKHHIQDLIDAKELQIASEQKVVVTLTNQVSSTPRQLLILTGPMLTVPLKQG